MSAEVPLSQTMARKEITQLPQWISSRQGPSRPPLTAMSCAAVPRMEGSISSNAFQNMFICTCVRAKQKQKNEDSGLRGFKHQSWIFFISDVIEFQEDFLGC